MDTKFVVALHSLILIKESEEPVTSEYISETLNTNSSYVRRILSSLVKADVISSASKTKGCSLLKDAEELRLSDIYDAVEPGISKLNMSMAQNVNDELHLCQCEKPVIEGIFYEMENSVNTILENRTLQNVIDEIKEEMNKKESGK